MADPFRLDDKAYFEAQRARRCAEVQREYYVTPGRLETWSDLGLPSPAERHAAPSSTKQHEATPSTTTPSSNNLAQLPVAFNPGLLGVKQHLTRRVPVTRCTAPTDSDRARFGFKPQVTPELTEFDKLLRALPVDGAVEGLDLLELLGNRLFIHLG